MYSMSLANIYQHLYNNFKDCFINSYEKLQTTIRYIKIIKKIKVKQKRKNDINIFKNYYNNGR